MNIDLSNEVVLITGASRGIGAALAETLGHCGAKVIVNFYNSSSMAEEVAQRVTKAGGKALPIQADISKPDQVRAMVRRAREELGPIKFLVNNATPAVKATPFQQTPWEMIENDFDVNVKGAWLCLQEVLPDMVSAKHGRVVSILTSFLDTPPPKGLSSYVIAKSALLGLTRSVAAEYGSQGITANMISPSMVETDLTAGLSAAARKAEASKVPVGRLATPADIIPAVLFLLSSGAAYMNGGVIRLNGGAQF